MKAFFQWCRRYISITTILAVIFIIYIVLLQDNSMIKYMEYTETIDSLKTEIKQATDTMNYYHQLNSQLSSDPELMERVVRERYNMVRDGEDVYVFATEDEG